MVVHRSEIGGQVWSVLVRFTQLELQVRRRRTNWQKHGGAESGRVLSPYPAECQKLLSPAGGIQGATVQHWLFAEEFCGFGCNTSATRSATHAEESRKQKAESSVAGVILGTTCYKGLFARVFCALGVLQEVQQGTTDRATDHKPAGLWHDRTKASQAQRQGFLPPAPGMGQGATCATGATFARLLRNSAVFGSN